MYSKECKLHEVLFDHPELITVLNRFGIYLGVGDVTVAEACRRHGLDADFFLALINTYLDEGYFPENALRSMMDVKSLLLYLTQTNAYYERFQLPNIERHFNSLVNNSDNENNNLSLLRRFFLDMKQELLRRIEHDKGILFPAMRQYADTGDASGLRDASRGMLAGDMEIEDKLNDLASFFIIHLHGHYDINLGVAVVTAIFSLSKDIRQNNRIRSRILLPMTGNAEPEPYSGL